MTLELPLVDFRRVDIRRPEAPKGLPSLNSYQPASNDDTIVIDAGSWQYRIGYASHSLPALVFDPMVHRYQLASGETPRHQIGRTAPSGVSRSSSRTPYEEDCDVILHPPSLEQILDDSFSKLHLCHSQKQQREYNTKGENNHPIFMTEVVANPPYCRREVAELLFEAYNTPKAAFGIDGLLAWQHWRGQVADKDSTLIPSLIINVGNYHTTIFLLVPQSLEKDTGIPELADLKRISYGGQVATDQMLRLLQAKYPTTPSFPIKVFPWQAEEIVYHAAQVADNPDGYSAFLKELEVDPSLYTVAIQFPGAGGGESLAEQQWREAQREALAAKRREQAQKLRERAERLRTEKINAKRQQVESMQELLQQLTSHTVPNNKSLPSGKGKGKTANAKKPKDTSEMDSVTGGSDNEAELLLVEDVEQEAEASAVDRLHLYGFDNIEALQTALLSNQRDLYRMTGGAEGEPEASASAPDYSLLEIPDSELSPEQIKEKRRQRLMKGAAEARERARLQKEEVEQKRQEAVAAQERQRQEDFTGWKEGLYRERQTLLASLRERQRKKKEAMAGDRRAGAASARLRSVVSLVQDDDEDGEAGVENGIGSKSRKRTSFRSGPSAFGDEEEDWLLYRKISRGDDETAGVPDEEQEEELNKRLAEIEGQLEEYDCDAFYDLVANEMQQSQTILDRLRSPSSIGGGGATGNSNNAESHRMHINVERFRVVEGLFQPTAILGRDQAGLIETIEYLIKPLDEQQQRLLASNILLVGGGSLVSGMAKRIERELQAIFPSQSIIRIHHLGEGDATRLAPWMGATQLCSAHPESIPWIDRQWYDEHGGERLQSITWFTNKF